MIRPTFRQTLVAHALRTLRVIWGAMAVAVFVDVAIGVSVALRLGRVFSSDIAATLTPALYAIAVAVAILAAWWRRLLGPERCVLDAPAVEPPAGLNVAPETDAERRAIAALARFRSSSVIAWALCESVAVIGLVLSIGTGDPRYVTGLAAASLVLLAYHVPSPRRVEAIIAAVPAG